MKLSYEKAMTELQEIVNGLESEAIGMDELSAKVKRAADLLQHCKSKLQQTQQEVNKVFNNSVEKTD